MNLSLTDGLIPSGYNVECSVVGSTSSNLQAPRSP